MTPGQLEAAARDTLGALLTFGAPRSPEVLRSSVFFKPLVEALRETPAPKLPRGDFWQDWAADLVEALHGYVNSDAELRAWYEASGCDYHSQGAGELFAAQRRERWARLARAMEPGRP